MLSKPGVSIEVRKLVISRHIGYFLLYAISNLFIAIRNTYFIVGFDTSSFDNQWYVWVLSMMFYCQGIFVATLRWYEPAFYQIAWRQFWKKIDSRRKKNPKSKFLRSFSVFDKKGSKVDRRGPQQSLELSNGKEEEIENAFMEANLEAERLADKIAFEE